MSWATVHRARKERKRILFAGRVTAPCVFCDRWLRQKEATLEHIVPRSQGGTNALANLTISCNECNNERGDQDFAVFRRNKRLQKGLLSLDEVVDFPDATEIVRRWGCGWKGLGS